MRMTRPDVNEMNVDAVDVRDELRQSVQPRLDLAPVVARAPVAHERLQLLQLDALRSIGDGFFVGPAGRQQAVAQVCKVRVRAVHAKRTYRRSGLGGLPA